MIIKKLSLLGIMRGDVYVYGIYTDYSITSKETENQN